MALEKLPIHEAAWRGDLAQLNLAIEAAGPGAAAEIERLTPGNYTALMCAIASPSAGPVIMQRLIDVGADASRKGPSIDFSDGTPMTLALRGGDPAKVDTLVRAGAALRADSSGYSVLLQAIHGRDVYTDPRLLELLRYLISHRVDLDYESKYSETALRVLSRLGRFDAVKLLLEAGANERQLHWTPLMRSVAIGTMDDMRRLLESGADLEAVDFWKRTAWLIAISAGNQDAATLLRDAGANIEAVGRCGKPALFHAVETHNLRMLNWLLAQGFDAGVTDDFGRTPLMEACEHDVIDAIDVLVAAGADVNVSTSAGSTLSCAHSPEAAWRLLNAGADPAELSKEARRRMLGLSEEPSLAHLAVDDVEFERGARRRFGRENPEEIDEPFWTAMIRAGVSAYAAAQAFSAVKVENPVWCADRFGQSLTLLPDGRVVQIAGEHEDSYDPDFCIYNDVFVHDRGAIRIYGYPEHVFPPTDFHTATLIGRKIYLIGSLGYHGKREFGRTPIFQLDIDDFRIERLHAAGANPGWIYKHRADLRGTTEIAVYGGTVAILDDDGKEDHVANDGRFVLDITTLTWRREPL
jgi:ankyrin repeat protein